MRSQESHEHPRWEVNIPIPFAMSVAPVTKEQYRNFDNEHASGRRDAVHQEGSEGADVLVTWYEAVSFCRWLSAKAEWAQGARLPLGEEWEFANRSVKNADRVLCDTESNKRSCGLLHGPETVWEWCGDPWQRNVVRGAHVEIAFREGWIIGDSLAGRVTRGWDGRTGEISPPAPSAPWTAHGFRVVLPKTPRIVKLTNDGHRHDG